MRSVSVVGTFHAEAGLTNAENLLGIIKRIAPEVIFLEAPVGSFKDQGDVGKLNNLEAAAVSRYCESKAVVLVPVDLPTPDESFFRDTQALFREIECRSYKYQRLVDEQSRRVRAEGFAYLNGEDFSVFQSELRQEIHETLGRHSNKGLSDTYALWLRTMERRDSEMISNINRYCQENEFSRGVFLVGAAHRKSIVEKTTKQPFSCPAAIRWD